MKNTAGISGYVQVKLFGPDGVLKQSLEGPNLVTDYGDQWLAEMARGAAPTAQANFKCASDDVAAAKSGAGSYLDSNYISGSAHAHDGWVVGATVDSIKAIHKWEAGEATGTHRRVGFSKEIDDAADGAATDCIAMHNYGEDIAKAAGDTLTVTWTITFLGA